MPVKTRIESFNLDYNLITREMLSVEAQRADFAQRASQIITDVKAQNAKVLGRVPKHTISVDGREGAPLNSVKIPNGVVFVEFELVFEAITWVHEMLKRHSPYKSGRYQKSHVLIADNVAVDEGVVPPVADKYEFVNVQPYARKIEKGLSSQAPDGVYQAVATMASSSSKFGNVARIRFGYVTPMFGAIESWAASPAGVAWGQQKSRRRKDLQAEWLRRQPAIIITMPGR
jgi:hypothetical protein